MEVTGAPGSTGARGETGTVGPSEVTVGHSLVFWRYFRNATVQAVSTATLSGLKASKSYLIRFFIHTYHPGTTIVRLRHDLNCCGASYFWQPTYYKAVHPIASSANTYRNGTRRLQMVFGWAINS